MNKSTIVLADRLRLFRQGVQSLLESEADLSVVADTGNGLEAVDLVERLEPDVLILGLMLPGLNGLEVIRLIKLRVRQTGILVLSMSDADEYVLQALRHGALGYILKDVDKETLVKAVRSVLAGRRYLCPPIAERIVGLASEQAEMDIVDPYDLLSNREREVLQLTAEGHTSTEIAHQLSISPRTVEVHRSKAMKKLGIHTRTELLRYALRRGLLSLDS